MNNRFKFGLLLGIISFPGILELIKSGQKEKEKLFLTCPKCGEVKDLPYKHFLVAHRYRSTPFVVLCKCGTSWDIQTGNLSWISKRVLEAIAQYSKTCKGEK